jgi:hypothetical protein
LGRNQWFWIQLLGTYPESALNWESVELEPEDRVLGL